MGRWLKYQPQTSPTAKNLYFWQLKSARAIYKATSMNIHYALTKQI